MDRCQQRLELIQTLIIVISVSTLQAKLELRKIYDIGNQTGKKMTPEDGARMLRQRFQDTEVMWLKPSQVLLVEFHKLNICSLDSLQVRSQFSLFAKADRERSGDQNDEADIIAQEERGLLEQAADLVTTEDAN